MIVSLLLGCALVCAVVPAALFIANLALYKPPQDAESTEAVSVLIPARNEESAIAECVRAVLASESVDLELIVLDDHSTDRTAEIVAEMARTDPRLRLAFAPDLPAGWCGKQFACFSAARVARNPILCFIDADVRLTSLGLARMIAQMRRANCYLLSGFPRQITCTPLEQLLLPLMHFLLLGFLPIAQMRRSIAPSLAAGCGQLILADKAAYQKLGGHSAIRSSRHDGITLPRAFRSAGFKTDLCDATSVASCRMYRNGGEVVNGLLKNATEGIAAPRVILPFSFLLFAGQVLPVLLLLYASLGPATTGVKLIAAGATAVSFLPRLVAATRFRQPWLAALFHPLAIILLLAIEWLAFFRSLLGFPESWKGRRYTAT
jgi:glycosyltransferase involved in cell wall biosynthesis